MTAPFREEPYDVESAADRLITAWQAHAGARRRRLVRTGLGYVLCTLILAGTVWWNGGFRWWEALGWVTGLVAIVVGVLTAGLWALGIFEDPA